MSTIDEDLQKLIDGLMVADGAVPAILAAARAKLPEELWPLFDSKAAPILEAADPAKASALFLSGFAGVIQSFKDGHGPMGHHSVHAG